MNVLTFDLETRQNPGEIGWKNFTGMGISYACAHLEGPDEYRLYGEANIMDLVRDMGRADLIVGFNILEFDLPLLSATVERVYKPIPPDYWNQITAKTYDILADIREALGTKFAKGWKLDQVAESNLTCRKNGDGALAPGLWKDGKHVELCSYVLQDVYVERSLWEHVLAHGFVKNKFANPGHLELTQVQRFRARTPVAAEA